MTTPYFVHESSYVDEPSQIGAGTKIWHFCHILKDTIIGERCSFGQNCVVGPNVKIGNNVKAQNNISIYEGVEIEDDVFLGPSMVFTNVINPRSFIVRKEEFRKTVLKKGSSIGANATVVCGTTIGRFAFIGAGSVVTKEVQDFEMVYGVPAKHRGWVGMSGNQLSFSAQGLALDQSDGRQYRLKDNKVELVHEP